MSVVSAVVLIGAMFLFLYLNPIEINTQVMNVDVSTSQDVNTSKSKDNFTTIHNSKIWIYGILILFSSIFVWFIRIIVKITLSNYHLSIDANERVIMIRTYLSLLKEGNGFDKDDKKVMLDNIFRPTNFGIIKDETKVTMMDILGSVNK